MTAGIKNKDIPEKGVSLFFGTYLCSCGGYPAYITVAIVNPPITTTVTTLKIILNRFRSLNAWTVPKTAKIAINPKMMTNKFIE